MPSPARRWWVLLLVSIAMFGNYYAYDALNPVVDLLRSQDWALLVEQQNRQIEMLQRLLEQTTRGTDRNPD